MSLAAADERRRWAGANDALEAIVGFSPMAVRAMEQMVAGDDDDGGHPVFSSLELCEILGTLQIKAGALGRLYRQCRTVRGLRAVGFAVSRGSIAIHKVRDAALGLTPDLELPRLLEELETAGGIPGG